MSLTILVAMVTAGIAAIVAAVHLTGGTVTATLPDAEAARRRLADDFADAKVREVWLSEDRHAAVLALDDGRAGLVWALGDRFLTRVVSAGDPTLRVTRDGRTVGLNVDEFTWHGGSFVFPGEREAQAVADLLDRSRQSAEGAKVHG